MSWNYRLIKYENVEPIAQYGIVEAYYNEAGLLRAHSESPLIGPAESEAALLEELENIKRDILTQVMLVEGEFEFADNLSDEE
jgi:hypothetical protein